jgi:porin
MMRPFLTPGLAYARRSAAFGRQVAGGLAVLLIITGLTKAVHADSLGPSSVPSTLPAESAFPLPPRLSLAVDYSAMLQAARGGAGNEDAASGAARIFGQIGLYQSPNGATGKLTYKVENRHRYDELAPQDLGFATGYVGLPSITFSDAGTLLTNLYWQHTSAENRWAVIAGVVDVTDYVDVYAFVNPWRDFSNLAFSTNPTVPAPNQGFGIAGRALIGSHGYVLGGLADTNGDPSNPWNSFTGFFDDPEAFVHAEIGYIRSFEDRFTDNIHVTLWHADARTADKVGSGHGAAISASWQVTDTVTPFARFGFAQGSGALYDRSASVGLGYATGRGDDVIGLGVNWSRPNRDSFGKLDDQFTLEAYWRFAFQEHFEITPDVQYVSNPALSSDASDLWNLGLRLRAIF